MPETIITSSMNEFKKQGSSENENTLPQELLELIEEHKYSKVDGFIHGNQSAKIINKETETSLPKLNSYYRNKLKISSALDEGDERKMSNQNPMDTLFNELKSDMRERETRTRQEISDRESRFEKQLERFATEAREREERMRQEAKDREERVERMITSINTKVDDHATYFETLKTQNFWGNIAMFAALVAILVALIIALQ